MTQNNKIRVTFTHPRDSRSMEVDVGPALTGQGAIDGLVKSKFIDAPNGQTRFALALKRTEAQLPLSQSLTAGGVQDGDTIVVTETSAGAEV
jgi:hypothetical protein